MAIIFTYPTKVTPSSADTIIITDSESEDPENRTKQASLGNLRLAIGAVGGTGTTGTIPVFTGATTLGDSTITTSDNNISIPGYIARTGLSDTYFGYEATGNSKSIALVSNGTQTVRSIHDGTNSYGWLGHNGNTRLYATSTGAQLQGAYFDIPNYIRHVGDTDSQFGFLQDNHFRVQTGGQTTIQSISRTDELGNTGQVAGLYFNGSQRFFTRGGGVEVEGSIFMPGYIKHLGENDSFFGFSAGDNFILNTDSGKKIEAGPGIVTLYSDTSETATTTSVARFATSTTGVIVYGQTVVAGAASERGGIVRYYNNANDRFVGISGPVTQGINYQVRLPDSVGTAGQVLKLNNPLISGQTQDLVWGDASGIETPISTADGGIGVSTSSVLYNLLIGDGISGATNSFTQSGDSDTAIQLPVGATSRRPVASFANLGLIRYNTTLAKFEGVAEGITDGSPDGTYSWVQFSVSP